MLGLGTLLGYSVGTVNLSSLFGNAIGSTQFQQICVITSIILVTCVTVTCYNISERAVPEKIRRGSTIPLLLSIAKIAFSMPKKIQALCWITFWTWIGWSPFHVYGSTWAGEIYYQQDNTTLAKLRDSADIAGDLAMKGSQALVLFSLTSLAGSVILPWVVLCRVQNEPDCLTSRNTPSMILLARLKRYQPDIVTAWGLSQLLFGASIVLAPFPASFGFASFIIASCGM